MIRRIVALVVKDLHLHWKGVVLAHVGAVAMPALGLTLAAPGDTGPLMAFVVNVNGLGALLWGEWFISGEKTSGTFAWLRGLPISSWELCASKFAVTGACVTSLWAATSLIFLRSELSLASGVATWIVVECALLTFAASVVASRWLLTQKLGQAFPAGVVFVLILVFMAVRRQPALENVLALWSTVGGKLVVAGVLWSACSAIWWATTKVVGAVETRRIVE